VDGVVYHRGRGTSGEREGGGERGRQGMSKLKRKVDIAKNNTKYTVAL